MSASFFSISTRRVSISLYQHTRYASSVQGTFPASQHLRDDISPQESRIPEKGEKKSKPKLYTELNNGTILNIHPHGRRLKRSFLINTSLLYDKEALLACDKRTRQLFDKVRKERLSFSQTSIADVQSGNNNKSS
ncbi:hypothetical protein QL285_011241 [Trifolium repens]|nr:hypothetical protein QL285_011241 [Trifolium repens]